MITVNKFLRQSKELQLRKLYRLLLELEKRLVVMTGSNTQAERLSLEHSNTKKIFQILGFFNDLLLSSSRSSVIPQKSIQDSNAINGSVFLPLVLIEKFIDECKSFENGTLLFHRYSTSQEQLAILEIHSERLLEMVFNLQVDFLRKYPHSGLESLTQDRPNVESHSSELKTGIEERKLEFLVEEWVDKEQRFLYLDNIRTPFNVGSIIRTACALGIHGIILGTHCPRVNHPRLIRSAMGSESLIPISRTDKKDLLGIIEKNDIPTIALETSGKPIEGCLFPSWGLGLLGHEEMGISSLLLEFTRAKGTICSITMPGIKTSLNVSVAAGIFLHQWSASLESS